MPGRIGCSTMRPSRKERVASSSRMRRNTRRSPSGSTSAPMAVSTEQISSRKSTIRDRKAGSAQMRFTSAAMVMRVSPLLGVHPEGAFQLLDRAADVGFQRLVGLFLAARLDGPHDGLVLLDRGRAGGIIHAGFLDFLVHEGAQ